MDINGLNEMMSIITIIVGALATWYAIFGKAPGFNNDYPKEMKADAEKMLRNFCWIIGPVAVVTGALEVLLPNLEWVFWVGMAIILPVIVVYMILFRKRFKQYLKKMK